MATKSDTATIESRRSRLLELLAEGKNQAQAAEVLQREGFPADRITIWRDVRSFDLANVNANSSEMDSYRSEQLIELSELKAQLVSPLIKPDRKIDLALSIIDREIRLLGTEAPKKSISVSVDANQENLTGYRKFVAETRQLSASAMDRVWGFCRKLTAEETRPAIEAHFPEEDESCDS